MSRTVDNPGRLFPGKRDVPVQARIGGDPGGNRYLIHGAVHTWSGPMEDVLSPVGVIDGDGFVRTRLGAHPLMGEAEALEALGSAVHAYGLGCGTWPTLSVRERIAHVDAFIPRMEAVKTDVVRLMMWEVGKTHADCVREFDRTVAYIRETITALKELDRQGSRFAMQPGYLAQIRRSPLGVVLCMGPFNYPLNETFTTLIPALIMGNTVIYKPPKRGVLLHAPLLKAFAKSFPPGVVNTVYGDGARVVGPLMRSGRIDVLAFIGSARVAAILKHQHPRPNRLRSVLGLEAKNPAVVLPSADLDESVRECVAGSFSFNGQRCTAIKIIFVHRSIADAFCARFATAVSALRVGMPWEEVSITPLAEDGKPEWLERRMGEAVAGGAEVINRGGGTIDNTIFYPAVLYPATTEMEISRVEQFGPLIPIVPFADEREVIQWAIQSPLGQQVALFGTSAGEVSRLIDPLVNQVCRININARCERGPDSFPFNGRKDSAEGTLSTSDALRVFSIRSLVAARTTGANEALVTEIVSRRLSRFLSTDFIL